MIAASKVVRVKDVVGVESTVREADILLKLTCRVSGKIVRLEVPLCRYTIEDVSGQIKAGVNAQVQRWIDVSKAVGS